MSHPTDSYQTLQKGPLSFDSCYCVKHKAVIIIFLFLPFSALVLLLVFSCSCKSIFVLNVMNRLSSEILQIRVLFYFQSFPQFKYILCNKYTGSNMKIYNTKLSHCRTIPRKNAAMNLKCHRRHVLFEITRNIGHKYSLAVCLQWKLWLKFSKKIKKKFSDNCHYQKKYFHRKPLE